jgi:hypothetical protein
MSGIDYIPAYKHINIISNILDKYKNVYIDLSWDSVHKIIKLDQSSNNSINSIDTVLNNVNLYASLFNKYSTRFLTGSDFVGSSEKIYEVYSSDVNVTSKIFRKLNNTAYRNIVLGNNFIKLYNLKYNVPLLK